MRKTQHVTRAALLFALAVALCVTMAVALLLPTAALAYTNSGLTDGSDEKLTFTISDKTGNKFDQKELQKLINALAGNTNNAGVSALATTDLALKQRTVTNTSNTQKPKQGNSTTLDGIPTSEIRYLANKTIIVELGGIKWIAVYLSTAKTNLGGTNTSDKVDDGDVILTLWQAYSDVASKWANFGTENDNGGNASAKYPANMYATSLIRNTVLNAGGMEATGMNVASKKNQSSGNAYAKFTMPAASGGSELYDYIVSPRYVSWQYDQDRGRILDGNSANGYANNESWGLVSKEQGYAYNNESYRYDNVAVNPNYSDWADDKIWLPSWTETGNSSGSGGRGIWNLYGKLEWGNSSATHTWLRSALVNHYHYANILTSDGASDYNIGAIVATSESLVRPALHLNLTAAAKEVDSYVDKPTSNNKKNVTYNGTKQTFDLGVTGSFTSMVDGATKKNVDVAITSNNNSDCAIENIDGNQVLTATKAGTYKVTVTPANGYRWKNDANSNDVEPIEFTLTISKVPLTITANNAEITYGDEAKNGGVTYGEFVNGEDESVLNGELKFTYGDYSVGSGVGSYNITPSGLTADNYEIEFKTGKLNVKAKKITVSISNAAHVYGATVSPLAISDPEGGWVNAEDKQTLLQAIAFTLKQGGSNVTLNSNLAAGTYEITAENKIYGNYDVTFNSGTYEVSKAALTLSGNFTTTYEYELDGNGSPVKRELKIAESQVTVVNGQKVTIKYGALTASVSGYDSSDDGYAVWKVGTYFVDVTISAPNHNEITQRITVTIVKAKPTVTPLCDRGEIWTSGVLPELTCTATLRNNQSVNGAISWITSLGTVRSDGYYDFYYRWVPEDQENFEIVDGNECYVRLYVRFASVTRFTVTFDPEGELFYETDSLNILKNYLTVTVTFSDGTTRTLGMNEYDLNCQGGSTLVAGDSVTVTVSYLSAGTPVERNFNVQVLAVERPPVDTPPTGDNPDPAPKDPTGDTISKAKEFFENTPLPLGYAALVLGGMLLLIIILAIAGRKPKKKD